MGRRIALSFIAFTAACQAVTGDFSVGAAGTDSSISGTDGGGTGDGAADNGVGAPPGDAAVDSNVGAPVEASANAHDDGAADAPSVDASSCTCAPQAPTGWTLVVMSTSQTSCVDAWGGARSTSYDGPNASSATCGCTCVSSSAGCAVSFSYDESCNFGCSGGCAGAPTNLTLASGMCTPATIQANAYQALAAPSGSGSCGAQPSANIPPIAWAHTATACSPTLPIGQGACSAGNACVPAAPAGFSVCAEQAGDLTCPFGTKQLEYAGASDTRGCTVCTCGAPTGFACGGSSVGYTTSDCSGTSAPLACGPAFNSIEYVAAPTGTCAAPSVSPTGSATSSGPVTFCCL